MVTFLEKPVGGCVQDAGHADAARSRLPVRVRYSEGSLIRRVVIPKGRYSEGSLFRIEHNVINK